MRNWDRISGKIDRQFQWILGFINDPSKEHQVAMIKILFCRPGIWPALWKAVLYYNAICIGLTIPFSFGNSLS